MIKQYILLVNASYEEDALHLWEPGMWKPCVKGGKVAREDKAFTI